jgi:type IV secretory pathway TrbD component
MTESSRSYASRIIALLLGSLAAVLGFLAFNVVDGVFGVAEAILGLAAWSATTVFVYRRSPRGTEDASA